MENFIFCAVKGPLSGLRQYLTTENLLKMMKNDFDFMLKVLFVLKVFSFLSWLFGYVEKQPNKNTKVNFKICDVSQAG